MGQATALLMAAWGLLLLGCREHDATSLSPRRGPGGSTGGSQDVRGAPLARAKDTPAAPGGPPAPETLPPMPARAFLVGVNQAWWGGHFASGYTSSFDLDQVRQLLDAVLASGGHLVRLWLFEAPQGYRLAPTTPQTQPLSGEMLDHLDEVLWEARRRGLWVYLTLLDANTLAKVDGELRGYGVSLLNNLGGELDAFNDRVLAPLCDRLDAHREVIFGVDLINEIQAAYKTGVFAERRRGPRRFLQKEAAFLKARLPWVRVTASAGWPDDSAKEGAQYDIADGFYSGLGLDFYDLHAYDDAGELAGAAGVCARADRDRVPVYLGEFGQRSRREDDALQLGATASFLNNARGLCFKGAFAWRFDPAELWWHLLRADGSERPAMTVIRAFAATP